MRAEFLDVDGIKTRVLRGARNGKPPLLLLHGIGLTADIWLHNIDELSEDFAVVAPDLLGHGFTAAGGYNGGPIQPHATRHILSLCRGLGFEKASVVGTSFGAAIACLQYFDTPASIDKLVLVGAGSMFSPEATGKESIEKTFNNAIRAIGDPSYANCVSRLEGIVFDPRSVPSEVAMVQMTAFSIPEVTECYVNALTAMKDTDQVRPYRVLERVEQILTPTLVIWGREDNRGNYDDAVAATERIPNARFETFEKCRHLPCVEHPALFNERVAEFLISERTSDGSPRQ